MLLDMLTNGFLQQIHILMLCLLAYLFC